MSWKYRLATARLMRKVMGAAAFALRNELREGQLGATMAKVRKRGTLTFAEDWTFSQLLEWAADHHGDKPFIEFNDIRLSFNQLNRRANVIARGLQAAGVTEGSGVGIMMGNHPSFLEVFFAIQKLGAYCVPINVQLVGDGLAYIIKHSELSTLVVDPAGAEKVLPLWDELPKLMRVYLAGEGDDKAIDYTRPGVARLADLESGTRDLSNLGVEPDPDKPCLLMYTSGTTGLPKAVASTFGNTGVKKLGFAARVFYTSSDKLYTCLPLFHANALMVTTMQAMWIGIPVAIGRRFSASKFWRAVAESEATSFNALGAMIPILLKTPRSLYEREHKVRMVLASACPADAWGPFQERFGLEIWEAYGAVDGGGFVVFNAGNAPVGSIGKPAFGTVAKLIDEEGNEVPVGEPGELVFRAGSHKDSSVTYFKNKEASSKRVRDGWLHTGDIMRRDKAGFLYFVGRNTDSMRRRGENVSAYEIEKEIDTHPDVVESAAFGVPAELGEDDIMVCVVPVEGRSVEPTALVAYLTDRLAKYAIPRYVEVMESLPKTATHRVIKQELKQRGVTPATVDLESSAR